MAKSRKPDDGERTYNSTAKIINEIQHYFQVLLRGRGPQNMILCYSILILAQNTETHTHVALYLCVAVCCVRLIYLINREILSGQSFRRRLIHINNIHLGELEWPGPTSQAYALCENYDQFPGSLFSRYASLFGDVSRRHAHSVDLSSIVCSRSAYKRTSCTEHNSF